MVLSGLQDLGIAANGGPISSADTDSKFFTTGAFGAPVSNTQNTAIIIALIILIGFILWAK